MVFLYLSIDMLYITFVISVTCCATVPLVPQEEVWEHWEPCKEGGEKRKRKCTSYDCTTTILIHFNISFE